MTLSEEFFSIVRTQNVTDRDKHLKILLRYEVYTLLRPKNQKSDNYHLPKKIQR